MCFLPPQGVPLIRLLNSDSTNSEHPPDLVSTVFVNHFISCEFFNHHAGSFVRRNTIWAYLVFKNGYFIHLFKKQGAPGGSVS